jgi:hypothetical protein
MLTQLTPYVSSSGDGLYHINLQESNPNPGQLEQILDTISNDAEKNELLHKLRIFVSNPKLINPLSNLASNIRSSAKFDYEVREDSDRGEFIDIVQTGFAFGGSIYGSFFGANKLWESGREIGNHLSEFSSLLTFSEYLIPPVTGLSGLITGFIVGAVVGGLGFSAVHTSLVNLLTQDAPRLDKYEALSRALYQTENPFKL